MKGISSRIEFLNWGRLWRQCGCDTYTPSADCFTRYRSLNNRYWGLPKEQPSAEKNITHCKGSKCIKLSPLPYYALCTVNYALYHRVLVDKVVNQGIDGEAGYALDAGLAHYVLAMGRDSEDAHVQA